MSMTVYTPAEVLHWLDMHAASTPPPSPTPKVKDGVRTDDLVGSLKNIAGKAVDIGRGAMTGLVQKQASGTKYELHEKGFEATTLAMIQQVDYSEVRKITRRPGDKYQLLFNGGSLTIKPVAHLVAGRIKAPVGWMRNGVEVPYVMLIEELSARCGIDIESE